MSKLYQSKFNPGVYPCTQVSWKYKGVERVRKQIQAFNAIRSRDPDNLVKGFWVLTTWKDLDENPDYLGALLDDCEEHGQSLILKLWDRMFGQDKKNKNPPIPKAALKLGQRFKSNTKNGLIWDSRYIDLQIGLMKKLAKFDKHPALEMIHWGETSIAHDGSANAYTSQLIRLWIGCKKYFPHTVVPININFLGPDNSHIRRLRDVMQEYGGGGLCNPDVVPGHLKGYKGKYPLYRYDDGKRVPYYIAAYDVLIETGSMTISPHIETWAMRKSQTQESFDMAINAFGATHVKPQTDFSSKFEDNLGGLKFFTNYVYPAMKNVTDGQWEGMSKKPSRLDYRPDGYSTHEDGLTTIPVDDDFPLPMLEGEKIMPDKFSKRPDNLKPQEKYRVFEPNDFGLPMARVTRAKIEGEEWPRDKYKYIGAHAYSTRQPFNDSRDCFYTHDDTYGVSFLLSKTTGNYIKTLKHGLYETQWMPSFAGQDDSQYLFGIQRNTGDLKKYSITTNELVDLDFDVPILKNYTLGKTEGCVTRSGKALYTRDDGKVLACVLVDFKKKSSTSFNLIAEGDGFNTATISDSGEYAVAMFDDAGIYKYKIEENKTIGHTQKIASKSHHALMTVDGSGKDLYVVVSEIVDRSRYVVGYYMKSGDRVVLLGEKGRFTNDGDSDNKAITGHAGHGPLGYITLSLADPDGPHAVGFLKLDGSKDFTPVAYTYDSNNKYLGEGHGVASIDGSRIAIACLYNGARCCVFIDTSSLFLESEISDTKDPEISEKPNIEEISENEDIDNESAASDVSETKQGTIDKVLAAIRLLLERLL